MTHGEEQILEGIQKSISSRLHVHSLEYSAPGHDVDTSEDRMKQCKAEVIRLREIRNELEELFSGTKL